MMVYMIHVTFVYVVALINLSGFAAAMWPQPAHFHSGSQVLWLSRDVQAIYKSSKAGAGSAAAR